MIRAAVMLSLLQLAALPLAAENKPAPVPTPQAKAGRAAGGHPKFDWSGWQRLPVQNDGRLKPLDTLADELVNLVTGRSHWTDPEADPPVAYKAPELLYCWVTRPAEWIDRPILRCEYRPLRQILNTDNVHVPIEGTYIALGQILNWKASEEEGHPVYWSKDMENRLSLLDRSTGRSPDSVGDTAADRAINGKIAELFHHVQAFLSVRNGNDVFIVPGLDPRALTRQTDPDDRINAWISLGALKNPEKWRTEDDVSIAAIMADSPRELARELLNRDREFRFPKGHPNQPSSLVAILPQLAQAQKVKGDLQAQIQSVKEALAKSREAYDADDAKAFGSSMSAFVREIGRLAHAMESARQQMTPLDKATARNDFDFGKTDDVDLNKIIWDRYEPLALNDAQMRFSAYPAPGATDLEIVYNRYKPFQFAWAIFLTALVVIVMSGMLKAPRTVYVAGLMIAGAAIAYSAWGFAMRIMIAARPPVTNMYETVIWASFVVSILGFWFCMIPFTWPGLSWSWRLAGLPLRFRDRSVSGTAGIELDRPQAEDQGRLFSGALVPVKCATSLLRLAVFAATVWFFTRSGTSFRIIELTPPVFGKAIAWSSLGTWLVGITTVVTAAWFGSRAALTIALLPVTIVPEAMRDNAKLWEQTFQRRYFLMGALPVACFGMMLAHFVGISSPDILNPRIGSITAVLRNNYWLTIHVLTIVSSYGAGGLAWGLGNLAMLYYLVGKYRRDNPAILAGATAGSGHKPAAGSGPVFDLEEAYGNPEGSIATRLKKAGKALRPSVLPRTIKAGFEDFGTGDRHLESARVHPPKEAATLASYTYKAQQVAVLLLAAGTILGGLWADVSWGRFWDWDPKEVWALISLLAYLVVLHGRFAGWVGTFGTNAGGVLAFTAILFSWYGVNFVLPMVHGWLNGTNMPTEVGLHAYAVGSGGLGYVVTGVVLNLILVVAAWARYAAETTDVLARSSHAKSLGVSSAAPSPEAPPV